MTDLQRFVSLIVGAGVVVVVLVVVVLVVAMGRRRPEPGLGPTAAATGSSSGAWNIEIVRGVVNLDAPQGIIEVRDGWVSLYLADVVQWQLRCEEVGVGRAGFELDGATIELRTPQTALRCTVSRERINRFARNSLKTLRLGGYADEFVAVMLANGAHPA